jgi:hypothetical protein
LAEPDAILLLHGITIPSPTAASLLPFIKTVAVVATTTLGCPAPILSSVVNILQLHVAVWTGVVHPAFGVGAFCSTKFVVGDLWRINASPSKTGTVPLINTFLGIGVSRVRAAGGH